MQAWMDEAKRMAVGQPQETRRILDDELPGLRELMRSKVPVEGDDYHSFLLVVLHPGMSIPKHQHPEYVCLFYAEVADTPVWFAGEAHLPKAGDFLVLPPNEWHQVALNLTDTTRVSVAMKVEKDGTSNTEDSACYPSSPVPVRDLGDTHLG